MTNPEPVYQITESELDALFQDLLLTETPNSGQHAYDNAYESGKEDGLRQYDKEFRERAKVVVE